ncbi:MAG TPA: hypothetical protein IAA30_02695 [Candidatus Treponema faecavium]|nr:hypothetical protein [Candidatus Treponema faecavium]
MKKRTLCMFALVCLSAACFAQEPGTQTAPPAVQAAAPAETPPENGADPLRIYRDIYKQYPASVWEYGGAVMLRIVSAHGTNIAYNAKGTVLTGSELAELVSLMSSRADLVHVMRAAGYTQGEIQAHRGAQ